MWIVRLRIASAVAHRSLTVVLGVYWFGRGGTPGSVIVLLELIVFTGRLAFASPHSHITTDADTAALLGHGPAQDCALCQPRELLRAEDREWCRLDLEPPIEGAVRSVDRSARRLSIGRLGILVLGVLRLFVQVEAQAVLPLVANRQVGEDEVSRFRWTVEICHARHWHASEHWDLLGGLLDTAMDDRASGLEGREEEEVRTVREGDVVLRLAFEDAQLDYGRRIDGSAVSRGYARSVSVEQRLRRLRGREVLTFGSRATCSRAFGLLDDGEDVGELAALGRHSRHGLRHCCVRTVPKSESVSTSLGVNRERERERKETGPVSPRSGARERLGWGRKVSG